MLEMALREIAKERKQKHEDNCYCSFETKNSWKNISFEKLERIFQAK